MTPVIPSTISNISLIPASNFTIKKNNCLTKCSSSKKLTKHRVSLQRFILTLSPSTSLFSQYQAGCSLPHKSRLPIIAAAGAEVAVEESSSSAEAKDLAENSDNSSNAVENNENSAKQSKPRPTRKSELPPVKDEDLTPGATFTGIVRSIQPFGAFVDFGAFTDGLVHVSKMSDSFVKDVGNFVSVGQEVKVRLIEANMETGRISLTMRESDDPSKLQQQKDDPSSTEKPRPARRSSSRPNKRRDELKTTKFVKGQDLQGTVKNLTRAGAFISLPEGEEGFLPSSEEADDGFVNMMGGSSLQVGDEVSVRVLRITRGQVTLTMKREENELSSEMMEGVVHSATNPFVVAFRKNKDIAAFLDEREKVEKDDKREENTSESGIPESNMVNTPSVVDETVEDVSKEEETSESAVPEDINISSAVNETVVDMAKEEDDKKEEETSESAVPEDINVPSAVNETVEDVANKEDDKKEDKTSESGVPEGNMVNGPSVVDEKAEDMSQEGNVAVSSEEQDSAVSASSESKDDEIQTIEKEAEESNDILTTEGSVSSDNQTAEEATPAITSEETDEVTESKSDDTIAQDDDNESPPAAAVEDQVAVPKSDKNGSVGNSNEQTDKSSPKENIAKATISPSLVKQLREETGAGMMDCKKALAETGGDIVKAQEFLRKKGLASAEKKASRVTAEGRIGSYIHDSRIGVLVEVNCETDFVSRGEIFKELVGDLAMQVAACPQVKYLVPEDVPQEIVNKEREIEMQKEDLLSKPEQIREKIVEGRIRKRLEELALLEQPYIKNDKVVVKDYVKQTIATIGENIKVKRYVRYNLGEGLEKKSQDFAAEVAAQTAAKPTGKEKPAEMEPEDNPAEVESKEAVEKPPPTVAVSATLVKQLREETGAGMMDCKKALSETGGDLEKAQEYLRKKGLSSADKKSSRLAAEGRIGSYIHDARIGVLIEVNCETDFVGRSEKFKELVDDLAMQVVACPRVQYVSIEDIPEEIVKKEKDLEMQREDLLSKPENIREKIVEGRVSKRLGELALLEQAFIKDDSVLVKDLVKQTVAALGENIKVRRFVRFTLGETAEEETTTEAEA